MNPYVTRLEKVEFVVTDACTGRCRHCSQGDHGMHSTRIDPDVAADAVRKIAAAYRLNTVMTFGGEPLLHVKAVLAIMRAATACGVPHRQLITNGYVTENVGKMAELTVQLAESGVNDVLLSVDAFHQETIPLAVVMDFARAALACDLPLRLQPAWLVSPTDDNPYNRKTWEILAAFDGMGIPVGEGNVIFPEGNARTYLAEYFTDIQPENPYVEDVHDVRCVSFSPNGDVLGGNVYTQNILEIIDSYAL